MKIGILTFVGTSNYGAALQAYALQRVLTQQRVQCEVIDYSPEVIRNMHEPKGVFHRKGLKSKLAAPLMYLVYRNRMTLFDRFYKHSMQYSPRVSARELPRLLEGYDRIVTGSDQIWNPELTNGDYSFFLDGLVDTTKKYSYAASIGTAYFPEAQQEICEKMLQDFQLVSIREEGAARKLTQRTGIPVSCDADPTFLLKKQDWMPFVDKRSISEKYIFLYLIPEDKKTLDMIRQFCKAQNCLPVLVRKGAKPIPGFRTLTKLSPEDFLTLIYHSEMVVTGSFHAMCFALQFEKPFRITQSRIAERTGRLTGLAAQLGLGDVLLKGTSSQMPQIHWPAVQEKMDAMRQNSMKTIARICNCDL